MKRTTLFITFAITACIGAQATGKGKDGTYEALAILTKNCTSCHQVENHPGALFLNRARLTEAETQKLIIHTIQTSQMPPEHKTFKSSPDGKKLLKWLQQELKHQGKK